MSSQDDYDFQLLGQEQVNSVKSGNIYLASLELSQESKSCKRRGK